MQHMPITLSTCHTPIIHQDRDGTKPSLLGDPIGINHKSNHFKVANKTNRNNDTTSA